MNEKSESDILQSVPGSSQMLAAIVQSSGDAIISKLLDGTITSWNDSATRIFGYTAQEMIGKSIATIYPPDLLDEETGIVNLLKKGERVDHFETQRLTRENKIIDISLSVSPLKDVKGNVVGASTIARDITRQKQNERLLQDNEERLQVLISASELGTWDLNLLTREPNYSDKYLEIVGFKETDRPQPEDLILLVHPDDLPVREKAFAIAMETGVLSYTFRMIRHNDKAIRWLDVKGKAYFDDKNKPVKLIGTIRDITEDKIYKQKIEESESRLRIAALSSELGTWDYVPATGELRWDDASRQLFGVDNETPVTVDLFFSKMHPDDREDAKQKMLNALNPDLGTTYDTEYRTIGWPDDQVKWIHAKGKAFFDTDRNPYMFAGTVLDVTEKRNALDELRESEHKFRLFADIMPQQMWTSDCNGNLNYFNKSVYDYSGLTPKQIETDGWLQIVHPEDRDKNIEQWVHSVTTGEPFLLEHRFRRHDGEYRWQLSRAVPQKNSDGSIQIWVGTSTDVHDQKTFSDELEKNVALRTKELKRAVDELLKTNQELEQFAYVSTHDLQEPLRKIQTFSAMLADKLSVNDDSARYLNKINASAARMSFLIKDLLGYSKLSRTENQYVDTDLNEILKMVSNDFELLINEKGAVIKTTGLPIIKAIPIQMNQLFYNHIGNSLKFNEGKPVIEISAVKMNKEAISAIKILNSNSEYIHLKFKDNGIGFSEEYNEKIFTIFQRLHGPDQYSGTGIGLAMCKKIVDNHLGQITAESSPGKGSVFNIYLPC